MMNTSTKEKRDVIVSNPPYSGVSEYVKRGTKKYDGETKEEFIDMLEFCIGSDDMDITAEEATKYDVVTKSALPIEETFPIYRAQLIENRLKESSKVSEKWINGVLKCTNIEALNTMER